jgi:hypothetical protein
MTQVTRDADSSHTDEPMLYSSDGKTGRTDWKGAKLSGKSVVLFLGQALCWGLLFFPSASALVEVIWGPWLLKSIPVTRLLILAIIGLLGVFLLTSGRIGQEKKSFSISVAFFFGQALCWVLLFFPSAAVLAELIWGRLVLKGIPRTSLLLWAILGLAGVVFFNRVAIERRELGVKARAFFVGETISWLLIFMPISAILAELFWRPWLPKEIPSSSLPLWAILGLAGVFFFSRRKIYERLKALQPQEASSKKVFEQIKHVKELLQERELEQRRRFGKVR